MAVALRPALPNPRPLASPELRGRTRFLCFPAADHEISVTATKISKAGTLVRCAAYTAAGLKITGGILRPGIALKFPGSASQICYVEINGGDTPYEVEIKGAPHALAADAEPRGLHLSGQPATLWFQVPSGAPQFTVTVSSAAPGETSLSQVRSPGGQIIQTIDTQTEPVARATITPDKAGGEWEGMWSLSIGKAPKGSFDDVYVTLDPALPQWFILDPAEPLTISAQKISR